MANSPTETVSCLFRRHGRQAGPKKPKNAEAAPTQSFGDGRPRQRRRRMRKPPPRRALGTAGGVRDAETPADVAQLVEQRFCKP